ncbi:MAG: hypothetical protein KatS3mg002_1651 [Candidatus Woesearchaeota archaeon]|nr:MAG: hypothetical protein KatS3mg002_1651 [Candidatus Woesearchaeota archaeon]
MLKNKFLKISFVTLLLFSNSCKEKEFIPPNSKSVKMGSADRIVPTGTAKQLLKYANKMAEVWNKKYSLISINGSLIGIDGYNKSGDKLSKWMFNYESSETKTGYSIVFNGDNSVSWVEVSSYNNGNPIKDFIDSSEALDKAFKEGLKEGEYYTMELYNNKKGFNWTIGSKIKEENKYDIKLVVANENK